MTLARPVEAIPGQASNRRYYRIEVAGKRPARMILVQLPPDPFESDEVGEQSGPRELPFCSMLRYLEGRGLPVPALLADRTEDGFLLQEDLGKATLFAELQSSDEKAQRIAFYEEAIDLLVDFQRATVAPPLEGPPCIGFDRSFTPTLLRWELDHFKEWLLLGHCCATLSRSDEDRLTQAFDEVVAELAETPYRLAHRDFQSTNLMRRGTQLVLIDFQDALMAPPMYDLVALLRDSYIALSNSTVDHLLSYYWQRAGDLLPFATEAAMRQHFHLQTVQRKLKDAGRFVFIDRVKGNPGFLKWVEPTLGYVREALPHITGGAALQALLGRYVSSLAAPERQ